MLVPRNEIKTVVSFVQCFHSSAKNEIHMHVQAMKYELCNFNDSEYHLNALVFKLLLHNINMNSKTREYFKILIYVNLEGC